MLLNCGVGEDSWESLGMQGDPHSEGDQPWDFFARNDAEAETPVLWPPHAKSWLIGKDPDARRDWGQEEKGTTENEMAGWHHWLDGHEFGWTPGVGDGQGGLACCDSWGHRESDTTQRLNWTEEQKSKGTVNSLEKKVGRAWKISWGASLLYSPLTRQRNKAIFLCPLNSVSVFFIWQQSHNLGNNKEAWGEIQARPHRQDFCCRREKTRTGSLTHSLEGGGQVGVLNQVRVGVGPGWAQGWGWRRGLGCLPPPGWCCVQRACQYTVFAPITVLLFPTHQKWQLSFWSFCILLLIILHMQAVIFSPL